MRLDHLFDVEWRYSATHSIEPSSTGDGRPVICVGEGSIDPTAGVLAMRYYSCEVDYLPALAGR